MKIKNDVLDILSKAVIEGNSLKLTGQVDRKLYVATNKVLELAGGVWNRKAGAHLWPEDDTFEIIDQIILTGEIANKKQELGFFPTSQAVVELLIESANINKGDSILEPSAGSGNILRVLCDRFPLNPLAAVEIDESHTELTKMTNRVYYSDFLKLGKDDIGMFDRIVMNPPFARNVAPTHVLHARTLLNPHGRLVSVMPSSVTFREDTLNRTIRESAVSIRPLPEGSFKESGTNVNTVIMTLEV
jgi:type I restriction-modification system DNA methylase subunit